MRSTHDRLAGLALFPEDMTIETEGATAHDRFAPRWVGAAEAQAALLRLLEDLKGF